MLCIGSVSSAPLLLCSCDCFIVGNKESMAVSEPGDDMS